MKVIEGGTEGPRRRREGRVHDVRAGIGVASIPTAHISRLVIFMHGEFRRQGVPLDVIGQIIGCCHMEIAVARGGVGLPCLPRVITKHPYAEFIEPEGRVLVRRLEGTVIIVVRIVCASVIRSCLCMVATEHIIGSGWICFIICSVCGGIAEAVPLICGFVICTGELVIDIFTRVRGVFYAIRLWIDKVAVPVTRIRAYCAYWKGCNAGRSEGKPVIAVAGAGQRVVRVEMNVVCLAGRIAGVVQSLTRGAARIARSCIRFTVSDAIRRRIRAVGIMVVRNIIRRVMEMHLAGSGKAEGHEADTHVVRVGIDDIQQLPPALDGPASRRPGTDGISDKVLVHAV